MKKTKLILAGVLILTGCSTSQTVTAPTALEGKAAGSVTAEPFVVAEQTGLASNCPVVQPFTATVNVFVFSGSAGLIVTSIDARFVDQFGIQLPPVTLPAPVPITQFGSALAQSKSQTFPVSMRFGCTTAPHGTVFLNVGTSDARGRQTFTHLSVDVR